MNKQPTNQEDKSGVRFTGRCACGRRLEIAYNPDLDRIFWNCFSCFPFCERATDEQRRYFLEQWNPP